MFGLLFVLTDCYDTPNNQTKHNTIANYYFPFVPILFLLSLLLSHFHFRIQGKKERSDIQYHTLLNPPRQITLDPTNQPNKHFKICISKLHFLIFFFIHSSLFLSIYLLSCFIHLSFFSYMMMMTC